MLPLEHPDRIRVAFDDHRLVANAGLLLPATLALRLGLGEMVDRYLDLGNAPGRANTAATPRSRTPSGISSTAWASTISPRDALPPTPLGWRCR